MIHLGGQAALVVPVADFLRLRALERAASPRARGCELGDFTDAERARLPRHEGPADPARIIEGPFDPANPRRILHT